MQHAHSPSACASSDGLSASLTGLCLVGVYKEGMCTKTDRKEQRTCELLEDGDPDGRHQLGHVPARKDRPPGIFHLNGQQSKMRVTSPHLSWQDSALGYMAAGLRTCQQ